jgi:hypothetical protein
MKSMIVVSNIVTAVIVLSISRWYYQKDVKKQSEPGWEIPPCRDKNKYHFVPWVVDADASKRLLDSLFIS